MASCTTAPEVPCKAAYESRKYTMAFADDVATGDTLTAVVAFEELSTSDLTITEEAVSGTDAQCRIAGGVAGSLYEVRFRVSTTDGENLQAIGKLRVTS